MARPFGVASLSVLALAGLCLPIAWATGQVSPGGQIPPGYVDPDPILAAARQAIGADRLRCVTISGNGYTGVVGQQREHGWNVDWPAGEPLTNYVRTMNWDARVMVEAFDRPPGHNPASWKYGLGWRGGTPIQRNTRQIFTVEDRYGWSQDGPEGSPVPASPEDAELWQLDLWLNPHGFLKAAALPGANPQAVWRWELGEMGRDGPTTTPEKVIVVSITVLGKYRVDATINSRNLLQRIHTWVPDPVLGDMNYEHEFTDASYVDVGDGIRHPTIWHHHEGWDDNFQGQNASAGHNGFGGTFDDIAANDCAGPPEVPEAVRQASFPVRVEIETLSDGVHLLGGTSHNSVAIEFDEFIAVVEAPLDEARSLAVIEEMVRLTPGKPIRFLVNTHQHHDHIGGLRTYMHIGATIVTHWKNMGFYTRDVLNYAPRTLAPDMLSLWPPTELAEGYQYERVTENYVISDGTRNLHLYYVQPLAHVDGMLMAYLPNERIVIEADLLDTHLPLPSAPTDATRRLVRQVRTLKLDVSRVVPIHGRPVSWTEVEALVSGGGR